MDTKYICSPFIRRYDKLVDILIKRYGSSVVIDILAEVNKELEKEGVD